MRIECQENFLGSFETGDNYVAQDTAFDIMPDGNGGNVAYALSGKTLYTVDLEKGEAKMVRELKKLPAIVDIAIWPAS